MARTRQQDKAQTTVWMPAFSFLGVVLFMMELNAAMNYVESRFADLTPHFLSAWPAWGLASLKLAQSAFWNFAQLESVLRITPFVTLPFVLLGLAFLMKRSLDFRRQRSIG